MNDITFGLWNWSTFPKRENENIVVDFEKERVKLPKLKTVKAKLHREFQGQIKSATVSQVPSGKYYVSIV